MKIEQWPLARPRPYDKNPRTHSPEQIQQLAASMLEFGFTNPLLVDGNGVIIAGHGRLEAARVAGLREVPVVVLDHLTENQRRALVIADNQLALNSGWDEELLASELAALRDDGFDLVVTGFSTEELDEIFGNDDAPPQDAPEDRAPQVAEKVVTEPGEIWELGRHKLICGDGTSSATMDKLMQGELADLVFTDPPYGMAYAGDRTSPVRGKAKRDIIGDKLEGDALMRLVRDALAACRRVAAPKSATYVCFTWRTYAEFEAALAHAGLSVSACIVWDKKSIGLGRQHYRPQHEFIFYCTGDWAGDKAQSDIWSMSRGNTSNYVHPTQKPAELVERAIRNSSKAKGIVLDCFAGSGTTMIAAETTGRSARLVELDPKYADVIVRRYQEFTGKDARLVGDGRTFGQVALARG